MSTDGRNNLETGLILANENFIIIGRHLWTNGGSRQDKFRYHTHIAGGHHRLVICFFEPDTNGFHVEDLVRNYFQQLPRERLPIMRDYLVNFAQFAHEHSTSFGTVVLQFIGYGASFMEPCIEDLLLEGKVARLPEIGFPDPTLLGNTHRAKIKLTDLNSDIDTLLSGTSAVMGKKYGEAIVALTRLGAGKMSRKSAGNRRPEDKLGLVGAALSECDKIKALEQQTILPLLKAIAELDAAELTILAQQLLQVATVKHRLLNRFGTETNEADLLLLSRTDGVINGPAAANDDDEQFFLRMFSGDAA